MQRDSLMQRPP